MTEHVILVDKNDNEVGTEEKLKAHVDKKLHRAISIFIFNSKGEMMLQQRAASKYHSGGLWTNTCCSHPRPSESVQQAAERRLPEEMGFSCKLEKAFDFIYYAELDKGLTEHEFDHVFTGVFDGEPKLNKEEAESYRWVSIGQVRKEIEETPEQFTEWFKIAFEEVVKRIKPAKE